jgi:hypothetical protein
MHFVDQLLESLGKAPMSATEPVRHLSPRTPSPNPVTPTQERSFRSLSCREVIDAVVQNGLSNPQRTNAKVGVFEIEKNGIKVATLTLPRTTFKLGETIDGVLDLEDGNIKCYQVYISMK